MATTISALNCPNCGGRIQPPAGAKNTFCPYCGSALAIDDGEITVHIHQHTYDEAELRRIELEEEHRKQEKLEQRERDAEAKRLENQYSHRKKRWRITLVSSIVLIVVFASIYDMVPQPFHDVVAVFAGSILLFGLPALIIWRVVMFVKRPRKRERS